MFKLITGLLIFTGLVFCQTEKNPNTLKVNLQDISSLEMINTTAEVVEHLGKTGIKVVKQSPEENKATLVVLPEINFKNGTIELELSGEPAPWASPNMRGFVGVAFRVDPENYHSYECLYLRPTNARANNQVRRNHSVQYVSHPEYPWHRLRKESPKLYESYVDLVPGEWTKIKIVVKDECAALYVHDADQPCLIVNDLKQGTREGRIALWLHTSTLARYRDLKITADIGSGNNSRAEINESFEKSYELAATALSKGELDQYELHSKVMADIAPDHPYYTYQYAAALALNNKQDESLKWLERTLSLKSTKILQAKNDSSFQALANHPDFIKLINSVEENLKPVSNSSIAFTLTERDLIPEGVAYDGIKNTLYISSLEKRKIVSIDEQGSVKDFTAPKQDGLLSVVGMEVDEERRHLWICSGWYGSGLILDIDENKKYTAAIHQYNIDTGELVKKYPVGDVKKNFPNDLTIAPGGEVYITDSFSGEVFVIENGMLKPFLSNFLYLNGITLSDDGKILFVADHLGIYKVDLATKQVTEIAPGKDNTLINCDGLAFYKNSLIAHQGSTLGAISMYHLNETYDRVIKRQPVELHNPLFDYPTTGELAGDTYYYIANAQLRKYGSDRKVLPYDKLDDVIILKTDLTKLNND